MQKLTIYHNPRCSKSRETLAILENQGIEFTAIEYLKTPLDIKQLKALRAHFSLKEFVRTHETVFKTLGLSLDDEQGVLNAMLDEPKLMQRPIVVYQNKAVIGRPPENVLALLKQ